ncbi:MAG: phosphate regulon sensor histidine kinase PhoR [Gammaproteobacteria bacterium]|nr:phosphate regulon sensor histidine kinase PhoR [Gammaproteobacteria bacterium]
MKQWSGEKQRFISVIMVGLIIGWATGYWFISVLIVVLGYLVWHLLQLKHLVDWLRRGANPNRVPDLTGAWEPVIHYIYRIQRRNRRRKARMRSLLGRFEQVASALPDATVVLLANNEIDWASEAADDLLGIYNRTDAGQRIENLIRHPEFHSYLKNGKFEEPLNIPSPVREDTELSIRIIPFGNGERILTARDISTFLRVQAMRRDFVANVSHELRTPLTVISGYLETMQDDENLSPEYRAALKAIDQQSVRMKNIVQDLLQLSRLESEQRDVDEDSVHMPSMISVSLLEWLHVAETSGHRLYTEINENLSVQGVEKELMSLVTNLVHNALRHTPAGTEVWVRWYQNEQAAAVFQVQDSGRGIEPEHIPRLTERFYRVDSGRARSAGGSGLGLSIVNHIVQRHNAKLLIDSKPGVGSCFTVTFPVERTIVLPIPKRILKS